MINAGVTYLLLFAIISFILFFVGVVSFIMFALKNLSIAYNFKYYIGQEQTVQLFNVIGTVVLIAGIFDGLSRDGNPVTKTFNGDTVAMKKTVIVPPALMEIRAQSFAP